MKGDLCERVRETTRDLVLGLALELVEVEVTRYGGRLFLRIYVDKEGGVTIEECAQASRLIAKLLERDEVIDGDYVLEVMSPGLDRQLKTPEHFKKFIGRRVKVKLRKPHEGKQGYTGILEGADDEGFTIELEGKSLEIKYESLKVARIDPEIPW